MWTALRWFSRQGIAAPRPPSVLSADLSLEWNAVSCERCNVLVEASPPVAEQLLGAMRPHLRNPIRHYSPRVGVPVPQPTEGTLILLEVAGLDTSQQAHLLRWLNECSGGFNVQIVSINSEPLFPSVETGTFDADLYYKLNIVLVNLLNRDSA